MEPPSGLDAEHIGLAMREVTDFLESVNSQLNSRGIPRLETMMVAVNFSFMVGECMSTNIPVYYDGLVKNRYRNGHPDLLPAGLLH
ncbi:MAG TPA: hypothetical protein VFK04_04940 [Gemmatimonadaceae bacterium]|nr:hypothetical protein [Gemmatimonadaceae bacterium]